MSQSYRKILAILSLIATACAADTVLCAPADNIVTGDETALANAVDSLMSRHMDPLARIANLERASKRLREGRLKFNDGAWKLTAFYNDVLHEMPNVEADPFIAVWEDSYPDSPTPYIIEYELELQRLLGDRVWASVSLKQFSQSSSADPESITALRRKLMDNKAKVSVDPEWYTIWSRLALLSERDDSKFIAASLEGIKRDPTYGPHYDAAADYFLPKWGGSSIALDQWARTASKETSSIPGSYAYVRTYLRALSTQYGTSIFQHSRIDWVNFKTGASNYLGRYPSLRNVAQFTRMACLAGDREETRRLIKRNPKNSYLGDFLSGEDRKACIEWATKPGTRAGHHPQCHARHPGEFRDTFGKRFSPGAVR